MAIKVYVKPSRSIHITQKNLGNKVVLRKSKKYQPVGVSFSPTIRNALNGVPFYYNRSGTENVRRKDWKERKKFVKECNTWYVYTPTRTRKAVIPDTIDDYERTRERRVLDNVKAKRIGKIKVRVGRNRWEYEWIDR